MFIVERVARRHRYLYLVESVREGKVVRQRTIKALGRKDALIASGELDRLAASIARQSERSLTVSNIDAGCISARRIGGPCCSDGCGSGSSARRRHVRRESALLTRLEQCVLKSPVISIRFIALSHLGTVTLAWRPI